MRFPDIIVYIKIRRLYIQNIKQDILIEKPDRKPYKEERYIHDKIEKIWYTSIYKSKYRKMINYFSIGIR